MQMTFILIGLQSTLLTQHKLAPQVIRLLSLISSLKEPEKDEIL